MVNESDLWIDEVQLGNSLEYEYAILGEDRYKVRVRNWEPELMDEIRVLTQRYPLYDRIPYRTTQSRFLFRDSALSPRWFSFLNSSQLRILRNSIYAMRGYRFDSEDMSRHFEQEDWYSPADGFSEVLFSEIERHNIDVIYAIERIVQQTR